STRPRAPTAAARSEPASTRSTGPASARSLDPAPPTPPRGAASARSPVPVGSPPYPHPAAGDAPEPPGAALTRVAPLIDVGINLAHDSYDHDRDAVLARAEAAGVV